jgi:hypothetical protein
MKVIPIKAGERDIYLRVDGTERSEVYEVQSSARKVSAQLSIVKAGFKEYLLKALRAK